MVDVNELVSAAGDLWVAIASLLVLVIGLMAGRKLFRKLAEDAPREREIGPRGPYGEWEGWSVKLGQEEDKHRFRDSS